MHIDHHHWYSSRLGREMGILVYGHWGAPLLAFPTSGGDEWEMQNQGMVDALADSIDGGRVKLFAIGTVSGESFYNKHAHPAHRSYVQAQFDAYVRSEVVPFIESQCQTPGIAISTMGASLGAYHAANTLFKHPDVVKRCFAMSGVYDMRSFMDGYDDDNFYFNNPVDYLSHIGDPWILGRLASCDIHLSTGNGPWEDSGPTYALSRILADRGISHSVDDWGPMGGHDWPYWKYQMGQYVTVLRS